MIIREQGLHMLDTKALVGTMLTVSAAAGTWLEQANAYGQLALTVAGFVVAGLTGWYTIERARKLRKERKENE